MSEENTTAATAATDGKDQSKGGAAEQTLPEDKATTTRHAIALNGAELAYEATVGTLRIDGAKTKPAASVFYAAFDLVDAQSGKADPARPVTFIFNGGPGSSTTFLLMGSIAPKRIDVPDAAPVPAAPYRLVDNQHTLLPDSDLVFVDAPGAGFSQIADKAKGELWGVDGDVKAFSAFIRAYLSRRHRWNSPKYVLGESYGTTRGAALAHRLQQDGVALNGVILISNILNYEHVFATSDQFYVGYFPTYASVAQYHGRAGQGIDQAEFLDRARAFANGPLRLALSAGASLDAATRRRVAERYAELTGLDADYVADSDLRVIDMRFRKSLLRSEGRIVGRYDGRVAGYDLDRTGEAETFVVDDAWLDPAYSSLCNAYLRDELGWDGKEERKGFADIEWSNPTGEKSWTWWHTQPAGLPVEEDHTVPFPNVIPDLAAAIAHQPTLKVLIGNGLYDLCTPFGQAEYDIDHLGLPAPLRGNVAFTYYPAGHMLYSSEPSLAKFADDLRRFYAADAADLPAMNERPAARPLTLSLD
ncbi:carboxypeptidase [Bifidobacterium pullorum subsp. saeculare]|uniref:Carboxypeptidase n=1 Tax=Bifidobacterium pullorum subsp. saeculare TaxID=78257 RepID=A0A938WXK9_9BIFI|nr:carboxypeptidase [Bifidobacterium pullorum]MBM6700149.1 carboxypeptidase [Bifidobacterium pullorum subsp. saeculare]